MIISTDIQNIPSKVWTYLFVAANLNTHHRLSFSGWTRNIAPDVKIGETAYFRNQEGSYYDDMPYVWKNMTVIKRREVVYVIDCFTVDNPHGKSLWTKKMFVSHYFLFLLTKSPE